MQVLRRWTFKISPSQFFPKAKMEENSVCSNKAKQIFAPTPLRRNEYRPYVQVLILQAGKIIRVQNLFSPAKCERKIN